ncbi:MAG: ATP-binding protein [Verrucomicrobiota bacterium]
METEFLRNATAILRKIHSRAPLRHIFDEILDGAVRHSQADYGSFIRIDRDDSRLRIAATSGNSWTPERSDLALEVGAGITGRVATTGETYCCDDVSTDPFYVTVLEEVASELALPVKVDGRVWGIINLDSDEKAHFDSHCILQMELLAEMVASAIEYRIHVDRERDLSKSLIEAEKHSTMGHLVAGIAHEVNNPLASILGCAEILQTSGDEDERKEAAAMISTQARRAGDLVKQLLAFSRRDPEENKELCSVEGLLAEVKDLVLPALRVSGVELKIDAPSSAISTRMNRVQIEQILVNLITNATHAIIGEGIVDGMIRISAEKISHHLEISVSDNGPWLLPGTEHQIFQPFFTTKEKGKGTGLGLSIARDIAHTHSGNLVCESVRGEGCTFTLSLPGAEDSAPQEITEVDRAEESTPIQTPRLLIVDDEAPIRWMLKKLLLPMTDLLLDAPDAEAGADFAREQEFDVVISDFHLPGMDGIELYEQVRNSKLKQFVLITGNSSSPRVQSFAGQENVVVLEKPFNLHELVDLIRSDHSDTDRQRSDLALSS